MLGATSFASPESEDGRNSGEAKQSQASSPTAGTASSGNSSNSASTSSSINNNIPRKASVEYVPVAKNAKNTSRGGVVVKMLLLGDAGARKNQFLQKYTSPSSSTLVYLGQDFKAKDVLMQGIRCKLRIWDSPNRLSQVPSYLFQITMGVVLMYCITDRSSFNELDSYMRAIRSHCFDNVQVVIVGNNADREHLRAVAYDEGKAFADSRGLPFFEAAADTNMNVNEVFEALAINILKARGLDVTKRKSEVLVALYLLRNTELAQYVRAPVKASWFVAMVNWIKRSNSSTTSEKYQSQHLNLMNRLPEDVARSVVDFL